MKKVLFVCLGNICRSPAAEGVLRAQAQKRGMDLLIESAGTGGWHVGDPPDERMIKAAAERGIDISKQRARQVDFSDFYEFDFILPMDRSNYADLMEMAPPNRDSVVKLFLDYGDTKTKETPDPYYGGAEGFETVLDLLERGAEGFLDFLEKHE